VDIGTCDLSDAYGDHARVLPPVLRHFGGRRRFSGEIVTIKCFEDNSRVKELAGTQGDGRVMLVDGGGSTRMALLGDMIGQEALAHGWAGIVVYGCIRDTAALAHMELGVMAIASSPRRSLKNSEGVVGITVDIAGVRCAPGDSLFADEDGVVIIDPALLGAGQSF
jgi:regulator of ribonuclease activity A